MKICIVALNIVPYFQGHRDGVVGGAEVQAAFLASALELCGHDVRLVVKDLPGPTALPYRAENAFASADGLRGLRFFHPRWTGITGALERADAEVYYQRNCGMITGLTALFCRRHGRVFVYGAGSDADFSPHDFAVPGVRDRLLFTYGLKMSQGFVVQNRSQEAAAKRRFEQPVRVIANGVWPKDDVPAGPRDAVVWIGGLWSLKRPELLLEIARRLPAQRFLLVGGEIGSQPEVGARVRREAAALANVEMRGRVPHHEIDDVLRRAALLVNTSSVEGFPNAYLEAWNLGVPVVTFNDVDGIIRETGAGVVCATLEEMVDTIRSLTADPARARRMGDSGRALVRERFAPAVLGRQYTDFFSELLARRASKAAEGRVARA
jgi:glycosyltransferase involved in cell wall biosynthesis